MAGASGVKTEHMQFQKQVFLRTIVATSFIVLSIPGVASAGDAAGATDPTWGTGTSQPVKLTPLNPPAPKKKRPATPRYRADWDAIAKCESGGRWHYNGPSGFDGGLQFLPSTWRSVMKASGYGFARYAYQATRRQQIAAAEYLIGPMGANPWRQWPYCWRFG